MELGLCLAGGGVKGAAHIGAIKALEEEKIEFEYIGGTSSGSIVATLYASGYTSQEIYKIFKKYCEKIKYVDLKNIIRAVSGLIFKGKFIIDGLNSGNIINELITDICGKKGISNISQIKKPLIIPSVDLYTGTIYCFTSKSIRKTISDKTEYIYDIPIGKAVQASCSYPGIFSPCTYKKMTLIDGGIRENVPWKEIKLLGAQRVLNIVFENDINKKCCSNIIEIADRSIQLICHELSNYELEGSDYLLKIKSKDVSLLDMNKVDELYELGYKTTKTNIQEIKKNIML